MQKDTNFSKKDELKDFLLSQNFLSMKIQSRQFEF